jgi:hypothetical protein
MNEIKNKIVFTPEHKAKLSASHKGVPLSENHRKQIGLANKGRACTEETKLKISKTNTGKKRTDEARKKMSEWQLGLVRHPLSEETKRKISVANKGNVLPPFSEEVRKNMSNAKKGKTPKNIELLHQLARNPSEENIIKLIERNVGGFWYGNVRYNDNLYCEKFNDDLKERVRAFWGYQCFECGTPQNGKSLGVHHVHYNKKTCCDGSPHDMIPLCSSCHGKTNHKKPYWEQHFTELLYAWSPDGKCFFTPEEMASFLPGGGKK